MPSQHHVGLTAPSPGQVTVALRELLRVAVNVSKHKNKLQEHLISSCSGMRPPELSRPSSLSIPTSPGSECGPRGCAKRGSQMERIPVCGVSQGLGTVCRSSQRRCLLPKQSAAVPWPRPGPAGSHGWDTPAPGAPASGDPSQLHTRRGPSALATVRLHPRTAPRSSPGTTARRGAGEAGISQAWLFAASFLPWQHLLRGFFLLFLTAPYASTSKQWRLNTDWEPSPSLPPSSLSPAKPERPRGRSPSERARRVAARLGSRGNRSAMG